MLITNLLKDAYFSTYKLSFFKIIGLKNDNSASTYYKMLLPILWKISVPAL